jgi:hypothetical protein
MNVRQIPRRARRLALSTVVGAAAVGSVTLAPSASAQSQDPQSATSGERMDPRQIIDLRMARMTETLKLDSAQQTKIRSMIADETMAMEELRKNGGGQRGGGGGEGGGGRRGGRAVGAGVVVMVRLPIAQAGVREGEAPRPRCAPSGNAPTSKSKQFSTRSS